MESSFFPLGGSQTAPTAITPPKYRFLIGKYTISSTRWAQSLYSPTILRKFNKNRPAMAREITSSTPKVHPRYTQRTPKVHPRLGVGRLSSPQRALGVGPGRTQNLQAALDGRSPPNVLFFREKKSACTFFSPDRGDCKS